MALLLLDRAQIEIRSEGAALALYESGLRRGTVPVGMVDRCVLQGAQTRLDTGVLMKLAEAGATTVLMSPRQNRRVAIILGPHHNEAAVRLAQARAVMDDTFCRAWACDLVRAKLQRQQRNLQRMQLQRPDARKPLFDALQTLQPVLATLLSAAQGAEPPMLDSLRGREGAAARAYFGGLAGVMPPAFGFAGRNRRPPKDPVNVCLSLGYTLLHLQAVQCCMVAGLDPLLGFYHRPAIGRESLASDLIEPLRPAVDDWIWQLLRERTLREEHFTMDKGACLLGKAGREIYYSGWEKQSAAWRRWLRDRTRRLAVHLRADGLPWLDAAEDDEPC